MADSTKIFIAWVLDHFNINNNIKIFRILFALLTNYLKLILIINHIVVWKSIWDSLIYRVSYWSKAIGLQFSFSKSNGALSTAWVLRLNSKIRSSPFIEDKIIKHFLTWVQGFYKWIENDTSGKLIILPEVYCT